MALVNLEPLCARHGMELVDKDFSTQDGTQLTDRERHHQGAGRAGGERHLRHDRLSDDLQQA